MYKMTGITVSDGVSEGSAFVLGPDQLFERFEDSSGISISEELRKYRTATSEFSSRLKHAMAGTVPDRVRDIFGAVAAYISNSANTEKIEHLIGLGTSASEAAQSVLLSKIAGFVPADDDDEEEKKLQKDLTALMKDFISSISECSCKSFEKMPQLTKPSVIIASELSPARFLSFHTELVRGVVLEGGEASGHLSTVLRDLGIPAVFGARGILTVHNGAHVLIDAGHGSVLIEPPKDAAQALIERHMRFTDENEEEISDSDLAVTVAGSMGAVGGPVGYLRHGLGLLRTEFLFMSCRREPTLEEMQSKFASVFKPVPANTPLTIRTFDFAGDKRPMFTPETDEKGPLKHYGALVGSKLIKKELKAVLLAAKGRDVNIIFPLITGISEAKALNALTEEVIKELDAEHAERGNPTVGLMIETPAAVLSARGFAALGKMFLIGTSSLAEYASAPREPGEHFTPALAKMVALACKAAYKEGVKVGIAGRFAMKTELLPFFMSMGVSYITADASSVNKLRKDLQKLADRGISPAFDEVRYHQVMDIASGHDLNRLIFGGEVS